MKPNFRAWDKYNKKMLSVKSIHFMDNVEFFGPYTIVVKPMGFISSEFIELMQSTGLKDKNGVEVFEGDIVDGTYPNGKHFRGVVQYDDESAAFVCKTINSWMHSTMLNCRNCEVIGNIWEHPELLERS